MSNLEHIKERLPFNLLKIDFALLYTLVIKLETKYINVLNALEHNTKHSHHSNHKRSKSPLQSIHLCNSDSSNSDSSDTDSIHIQERDSFTRLKASLSILYGKIEQIENEHVSLLSALERSRFRNSQQSLSCAN
jgi:hypothetical protein